ncbi:hypothetical protein NN561_016866 [Cricetulus griseus]
MLALPRAWLMRFVSSPEVARAVGQRPAHGAGADCAQASASRGGTEARHRQASPQGQLPSRRTLLDQCPSLQGHWSRVGAMCSALGAWPDTSSGGAEEMGAAWEQCQPRGRALSGGAVRGAQRG